MCRYILISEVGGCSTGKSFGFVRACVSAVWLPSGIGSQCVLVAVFPFPFGPGLVLGLFVFWSWVGLGSFPFSLLGPGPFHFPFPHSPNFLSNFSWAYRYPELKFLQSQDPKRTILNGSSRAEFSKRKFPSEKS